MGNDGIPLKNVRSDHHQLAKFYTCAFCNLLIGKDIQLLICGHCYCLPCLEMYKTESSDCFFQCGVAIQDKNSVKKLTEREIASYNYITTVCTTCKRSFPKHMINEHALFCEIVPKNMSKNLLQQTDVVNLWTSQTSDYSDDDTYTLLNYLLQKLNWKTTRTRKSNSLPAHQGAALKSWCGLSSRMYIRLSNSFRRSTSTEDIVLPSYKKVLTYEKSQYPSHITFETVNKETGFIKRYSEDDVDGTFRSVRESYENKDGLLEDIVPNCEGAFVDPARVFAKMCQNLLPHLTKVANEKGITNISRENPYHVILKVSQDGLSGVPEMRSKDSTVLPDKII